MDMIWSEHETVVPGIVPGIDKLISCSAARHGYQHINAWHCCLQISSASRSAEGVISTLYFMGILELFQERTRRAGLTGCYLGLGLVKQAGEVHRF